MDVKVRNLIKDEVVQMVDWTADEGWNPGLHDAEAFYATDPDGFYGCFDEKGMAGCYSLVRYEGDMAFAGCYVVRPDLRGGGVGRLLLNDVLARAQRYNLGIDGVLQMVPKYERSGFIRSHENARFRGVGEGEMPEDLHIIEELSIEELEEFDSRFFGCKRGTFLEAFVDQPGTVGLVSMVGDKVNGYGLMRKCRQGRKVGPLFADDATSARKLLSGLFSLAFGEDVFLDAPMVNRDAVSMAQEFKMEPVFRTARMYTKNIPRLPWERVYGITTFELG
ncbi:MAG: hypothetical protein A4E32_02008 [Methanomassiliicoccales archaeon PtaU1.Bin124]|nr:MAG: hypothetical protein A4E32_02008 [Methanomassiliicoccales archaeon PtaU1.Bin124]